MLLTLLFWPGAWARLIGQQVGLPTDDLWGRLPVAAGIMAMAWGDAAASIFGRRMGGPRYRVAGGATKSLGGSLACALFAFLGIMVAALVLAAAGRIEPGALRAALPAAVAAALAATLAEAVTHPVRPGQPVGAAPGRRDHALAGRAAADDGAGRMKLLLTGGMGYLGGRLARRLREAGHAVRLLVRAPERARALAEEGFELSPGDLASGRGFAEAVAGCEAVVHTAAQVKNWSPHPEEFERTNVGGSWALAEAAQAAGVRRFLYTSSFFALGPSSTAGRWTKLPPVGASSGAFLQRLPLHEIPGRPASARPSGNVVLTS